QREAERAVRDAERTARKAGVRGTISEAQWFYQEGLRLRQQGDQAGAERVWRSLIQAFRDVAAEKPWGVLAERGLAGSGGGADARRSSLGDCAAGFGSGAETPRRGSGSCRGGHLEGGGGIVPQRPLGEVDCGASAEGPGPLIPASDLAAGLFEQATDRIALLL